MFSIDFPVELQSKGGLNCSMTFHNLQVCHLLVNMSGRGLRRNKSTRWKGDSGISLNEH